MLVDDEIAANYNIQSHVVTPKHQSKDRKLSTKSSFLIPNATCQKCGKDVFYYDNLPTTNISPKIIKLSSDKQGKMIALHLK